jgi:hypothetical protein
VTFATTTERLLLGETMEICDGRIHPLDSSQGYPGSQYFEVWLRRANISRLVGLFPYALDSPLTAYSLLNPATNSPMGSAKVEVAILETEERAKIWLAKSLTNERVRTLLSKRMPSAVEPPVVPDKPQEHRGSPESESLGTPLQTEDPDALEDLAAASLLVAPPKYSVEPAYPPFPQQPQGPQVVTFPIRPEPVRFSTTCSVDSLEFQSNEDKQEAPLPHSNGSDQPDEDLPSPFPLDQSLDSLTPSSPPPPVPPPAATVTPPPPEQTPLATFPTSASVHVLELSIEGSVDPFVSSEDSLGYFVCYDFPGLDDHEVPPPPPSCCSSSICALSHCRSSEASEDCAWWTHESSLHSALVG